jgi:hypothetical protein
MSSPDHLAADRQRVRPYAMTGGRTRPSHDALPIETLVPTTSTVDLTPHSNALAAGRHHPGALLHLAITAFGILHRAPA